MKNQDKNNAKKEVPANKNVEKQSPDSKSDNKRKQKVEKDYSPSEGNVIGDGSAGLSGTSAI